MSETIILDPPEAGRNLVTNNSFEFSVTDGGWLGTAQGPIAGTSTLARSNAQAFAGTYAALVTAGATGTTRGASVSLGVRQAGVPIKATVRVRANSGTINNVVIAMQDNSLVNGNVTSATQNITTSDWFTFTLTWIPTALSVNAKLYVYMPAAAASSASFFIDHVQVHVVERPESDITPWVDYDGIDWGDAAIEQYLAEATLGQAPVDFRVPNRKIEIPLILKASGPTTFEQARRLFNSKVARFQHEGGWLSRETDAGIFYADIVGASLKMGGSTHQGFQSFDPDALLILETLPDFYGDEIELGSVTETTRHEARLLSGVSYEDVARRYRPTHYWRLGVAGGTDLGSTPLNLTAAGGVTIGGFTPGALNNDPATATDFDGTDDRLTSAWSPFVAASNLFISGWAWRDSSGTIDTLFGSSTATAGAWVQLYITTAGGVNFTVNGGTTTRTFDNAWPGTAQWVHWAVMIDEPNDEIQLWINGQDKGNGVGAALPAYNAAPGTFQIGARSGSADPFDGKMQEVVAFTAFRTMVESPLLYQRSINPILIKGDYPARTRIVVTDLAAQSKRSLLWGIRSRHWKNDPGAELAYEANDMAVHNGAVAVNTDASDGFVITDAVPNTWASILSFSIDAILENFSHTGTYRVWVRARHNNTSQRPFFRLLWDVGDFTLPVTNAPVQIPSGNFLAGGELYMLDLGEVRLDAAPVGDHQWSGVIQGSCVSTVPAGIGVSLDKVWLVPVDEGYGVLRAIINSEPGFAGWDQLDEFIQSAGNLTGKSLGRGGTWAGAGDGDDYTVNTTTQAAQRSAISDTTEGRYCTAGSAIALQAAQVDLRANVIVNNAWRGLAMRYVDLANHLFVGLVGFAGGASSLQVNSFIADNVLGLRAIDVPVALDQWYTLRVIVDTAGNVFVWFGIQGSVPSLVITVQAASLATGGALDDGTRGLYDFCTPAIAHVHEYDNYGAWTPATDAVIYPSQTLELSTAGAFRSDSNVYTPGVNRDGYGPVSDVVGDLPRLPPSGLEDRPVELFVRPSRGDMRMMPDDGIDDFSVQVFYNPSWLFTPGS